MEYLLDLVGKIVMIKQAEDATRLSNTLEMMQLHVRELEDAFDIQTQRMPQCDLLIETFKSEGRRFHYNLHYIYSNPSNTLNNNARPLTTILYLILYLQSTLKQPFNNGRPYHPS